jgi:protein-tyrosine phosphatase
MRRLVDDAGLAEAVVVDSAGTAGYHVGEGSDRRTVAEAHRRGLAADHRARQLQASELSSWDLILVMDEANERDVRDLARADRPGPSVFGERTRLLRSFDALAVASGELEVSDPYYDDDAAFAVVFDQVERACQGLLQEVRRVVDSVGREARSA